VAKWSVVVCRGPDCGDRRDSASVVRAFEDALADPTCALGGHQVTLQTFSCFGRCRVGPNVLVRESRATDDMRLLSLMPTIGGGILYNGVKPDEARRILEEHIGRGQRLVRAPVTPT
jgi:(2Fe-2S) ferredoxin